MKYLFFLFPLHDNLASEIADPAASRASCLNFKAVGMIEWEMVTYTVHERAKGRLSFSTVNMSCSLVRLNYGNKITHFIIYPHNCFLCKLQREIILYIQEIYSIKTLTFFCQKNNLFMQDKREIKTSMCLFIPL